MSATALALSVDEVRAGSHKRPVKPESVRQRFVAATLTVSLMSSIALNVTSQISLKYCSICGHCLPWMRSAKAAQEASRDFHSLPVMLDSKSFIIARKWSLIACFGSGIRAFQIFIIASCVALFGSYCRRNKRGISEGKYAFNSSPALSAMLTTPKAAPRLDEIIASWLARSMNRYNKSGLPISVTTWQSSLYVLIPLPSGVWPREPGTKISVSSVNLMGFRFLAAPERLPTSADTNSFLVSASPSSYTNDVPLDAISCVISFWSPRS
mmetsp:Transcript_3626/g.13017  ORF Transcript_3626/g.13017 Transcript_3626/m.13017 type:complete len:268 (+) Transcript_3626:4423-5226(+)